MTKIKNFRVSLRPREMARTLKKEHGIETTPELELSVEQLIKDSKKWVQPAAVYTTLTRQTAEKTTTVTLPADAIAVSLIIVSVGPHIGNEIQNAASDISRVQLLQALMQEALTQSVQFVIRLISDQAKEEDCDMSTAAPVLDSALARSLASLLGVHRIELALDANVSDLPSYSRVCHSYWTPKGKGSARRSESPARVEKVAA